MADSRTSPPLRSAGCDDRRLEPGDYEHSRSESGSRNHPFACKPCNELFPGRDNSCKHGQNCEYCSIGHDRPKHRGESWEEHPPDLRALIEEVSEVPHSAVDQCKRMLLNLGPQDREDKTRVILEEMSDISEQAQNQRPESLRLQGARHCRNNEAPGPVELDARCECLVGALHSVVRKMADAKVTVQEMRERLDVILDKCRALPKLVAQEEMSVEQLQIARKRVMDGFHTLRYKCIHRILELVVDEDDMTNVDPSETLKRLERVSDIVKTKLASVVKFMEQKLEKHAEEIDRFMLKRLEPSRSVQDVLDRLLDMTEDFEPGSP